MSEQLEEILTELEDQETPSGGLVAKAFSALGDLVKSMKGKNKMDDDEELSEEELAALAAEAGDEEDKDKKKEGDENEEDDETLARSFYDRALQSEPLSGVVDGVAIVRELLKSFSDHIYDTVKPLVQEVKALRKSNAVLCKSFQKQEELNKSVSGFFENIGQHQSQRVAPYTLLQKSGANGNGAPDANTIINKSIAAVQKGQLSARDARRLEIAATSNLWNAEMQSLYAQVEAGTA